MEIHNYHPVTSEYLVTTNADESPLEPGVFLIPAHATTIAPPPEQEGHARIFTDGSWAFVPDHRGETWWKAHNEPVVIEDLGAPEGMLSEDPAAPPLPELPLAPLSPRQLRLGLLSVGTTEADIDALIEAMPEVTDEQKLNKAWSQIEWKYATSFDRNHPLIAELAPALGFTTEQIDALWAWALGL